MSPTRREFTLLAAGAVLALGAAGAPGDRPIIIALSPSTPGVSAPTRASLQRAAQDGADFLETALSPSQDGALIASSERELSAFTDVAGRSEFADRRATKIVGGQPRAGWFIEDFTLAELKSLVRIIPRPPRGGQAESLLTFQDVVDTARAASVRMARVIGVYVGLHEPGLFGSLGLAPEPHLAESIRAAGYNSPAAALFVYASEVPALETLRGLCRARLARRINDALAANLGGRDSLKDIRTYADAVALDATLLAPDGGAALVSACRAAGLAVHAWAPTPGQVPRGYEKQLAPTFCEPASPDWRRTIRSAPRN